MVGLGAHRNVELLASQIREFSPRYVAMSDSCAGGVLAEMDLGPTILDGPAPLTRLAALPVDTVLCATVGAAGLDPLLAAIDAGNRVAVANKEPFVMAGKLIMERAAAQGVEVLPVDSEHSAIFQCSMGHAHGDILTVHLTASGGPFYDLLLGKSCSGPPGRSDPSPHLGHGRED